MSRLQERQLQLIGYVIVMTSNIERIVDQILVEMLETKFTIAAIVVTDLPIQEKIQMTLDLMQRKFQSSHWITERSKVFFNLFQETNKLRNDLAHGATTPSIASSKLPMLIKYRARRKNGKITRFDTELSEEKLSEYGGHVEYSYLCIGCISLALGHIKRFRRRPAPRNAAGELYGSEEAYLTEKMNFPSISIDEAQRRIIELQRRISQPDKNPPRRPKTKTHRSMQRRKHQS